MVPPTSIHMQPGSAPLPLGTSSYSRTSLPAPLLTLAIGGEYAKIRFPKPDHGERRAWTRGQVQEFSARSRSRMLQMFAKTDLRHIEHPAYLVTLTYHKDWPETSDGWKRQLEEYTRRLKRRWPAIWYVWRLEFQERGAPHFHLLVFNVPPGQDIWLEAYWIAIVGRCCKWCLMYLADAVQCKSWEQVRRYCSKYCAKRGEDEPIEPGRFWGVQNRANREEHTATIVLSDDEAFKLRRIFKRLIRVGNGYHKPGGPRSGVWVRCSNETAKRALTGISAHDAATLRPPPLAGDPASWRDMPGPCSDWSSTADWAGPPQNSIDRMPRSAKTPLLDAADLAARRARRFLA